MVRDVAGGVDAGCAGPAAFVDENAVVLGDRLACDGRHDWFDPDTSHGEVAGHPDATSSSDRLQPVCPLEPGNVMAREQIDPAGAMDSIHERADFPAQHPLERESAGKDGGHVHPELR